MGCNYCNDRVGGRRDDRRDDRRDHRYCCDWDKFLFGDRRRDNVRGAEDRNRGCRGRRDNVMGAEDNRRRCGCNRRDNVAGAEDNRRRRHRNCFCHLFW
ncbi:hypothetical protein LCL96_00515 [Rossellomorea aquimaris]|uniref:hypothetical protein n=1 Tax=Rossellomorea TaxID=2837508 RepID=UPI001CD79650|nr:hypothetical protein [Rossellomorea aquimaris]MCA1057396.1 hypothetical protein [Rossellomorea aquimaris]